MVHYWKPTVESLIVGIYQLHDQTTKQTYDARCVVETHRALVSCCLISAADRAIERSSKAIDTAAAECHSGYRTATGAFTAAVEQMPVALRHHFIVTPACLDEKRDFPLNVIKTILLTPDTDVLSMICIDTVSPRMVEMCIV